MEEIETRFSICDHLQSEIITNLERAEALRQSILKSAFEGMLVLRDPNDKPASVLLEHIRSEKARAEALKKERKRAGKTRKKREKADEQLMIGNI